MKENLFEMGANFGESWESDNKNKHNTTKISSCKETLAPGKASTSFCKRETQRKSCDDCQTFLSCTK